MVKSPTGRQIPNRTAEASVRPRVRPASNITTDIITVRPRVRPASNITTDIITVRPGAGTLWQLGVHPALQSCGIGTLLVRSAEQRISARGLALAELGVEESNPRARALYERLGYRAFGSELESWDVEAEDGSLRRYETLCTLMRKDLA
ncbi:GNAT family N-acetyltransferase [Kitasatospora purpeofusca]|uniref:GNAT family N-acetyltransferase n=1 Tax=Kitasatospora purpeofusca TaxID=67352 RepID=UPI002E1081F2|nr:GNAT family N-acetyltransferase [Kitasatospora purpeofusca]